MARYGYIPHDQDREDQRLEEKAERRAARNEQIDYIEPDPRFGNLDPNDEEFGSPDEFAEYLFDCERTSYTHYELQCVWVRSGIRLAEIRAALSDYGLTLQPRLVEKTHRGFTDNPHNRYTGNPMCGGGGGNSILGLV